jgi:hypothetical protein
MQQRKWVVFVVALIAAFASVMPAAAQSVSVDLNASVVDCNIVVTFNMPEPPNVAKAPGRSVLAKGFALPLNTVYVFNYDFGVALDIIEVTGEVGSPQTVLIPIDQYYLDEDVTINLNEDDDDDASDFYDFILLVIPDSVVDACLAQAEATSACPFPLPSGSVIYNVPQGAPAFFAADLSAGTGFNLKAGDWYISEFSGDFAKVWIACQARPVWIPTNAVAR